MKVKELTVGMLIQPISGMRWVKRQNTLGVEPDYRKIWKYHSHKPLPMGRGPAMYVDNMPAKQREAKGFVSYGSRIVMLGGMLIAVDSSAWHRIKKVKKE